MMRPSARFGRSEAKRHRSRGTSIEVFIVGIERGNRHVDEFQMADRAMAAAGVDHNRRARANGVALAVELHFTRAFEDVINFDYALVIMRLGIVFDGVDMKRCRGLRFVGKEPASEPTRTLDRLHIIALDQAKPGALRGCFAQVRIFFKSTSS